MKSSCWILFFAIALLPGLVSCGARDVSSRPLVAATIFPLADWCKILAPAGTDVMCVIPPNHDHHIFDPSIQDAKKLSRARCAIGIGLGFDNWIQPLIQGAAGGEIPILLLGQTNRSDDYAYTPGEAVPAHFSQNNPHLWLDPIWAQEAVMAISQELQSVFPEDRAGIEERTLNYQSQLRDLHFRVAETINRLHYKQFVGDHSAFYHFCMRYGLEEIASLEPWPGKELSILERKQLIDRLRDLEHPVIFMEPLSNDPSARLLAEEVPCSLYELDPIGNPTIAGRNSYLNFMRFNLHSLEKGLGDESQ